MSLSTHKLLNPTAVRISVNGIMLDAELEMPAEVQGLVIFAHGTGSSRLSPRNIAVARRLRTHSLATLLVDLLTGQEDSDYKKRFDIDLLTERLTAITDWAQHNDMLRDLPIGYFGASTGAAAALLAAAGSQDVVKAIVSRGGRVDLADKVLGELTVPTMFIVGQNDFGVAEVNEEAFLKLKGKKELSVIPGATHLFEETGALDRVAILAAQWFNEYLGANKNGQSKFKHGRSGDRI